MSQYCAPNRVDVSECTSARQKKYTKKYCQLFTGPLYICTKIIFAISTETLGDMCCMVNVNPSRDFKIYTNVIQFILWSTIANCSIFMYS